jgi:hypothetical protein
MSRLIYDYTKEVLQKVSTDPKLFLRELRKALNKLFPHEIEQLKKWLIFFTEDKPELQDCLYVVD